MSWPPASDYQDAIQNPGFCFRDPDLMSGQLALNRLGLPRVASGNFASVYEVQRASEKWAVRCFLRQGADQRERYQLLSRYLSGVAAPGLVGFSYLPEGIRVRGQWYPVVRMEWVEGLTLQSYVAGHVNDGAKLRSLASQWRELLGRLRQSRIAHCDLQHGNVLVTPREELRLVDYDGMYVPPLRGRPAQELGHPNYQHPRRTASDYDETLDNFSAVVIYTALRAMVADPGLWGAFDTGENLLFSAADFKAPDQSALLARLGQSQDAAVRTLAERIAAASSGPRAQAPDCIRLIESLPPIPEPERWWQSAPGGQGGAASAGAGKRGGRGPSGKDGSGLGGGAGPGDPQGGYSGTPWWKRGASSYFYGLTLADWLVPAKLAEILRSKRPALPGIGQVVRERAVLPASRAARLAGGCVAAAGLSCLAAVALTIGLAFSLQILAQQVAAWLGPPPPGVSAAPRVPPALAPAVTITPPPSAAFSSRSTGSGPEPGGHTWAPQPPSRKAR